MLSQLNRHLSQLSPERRDETQKFSEKKQDSTAKSVTTNFSEKFHGIQKKLLKKRIIMSIITSALDVKQTLCWRKRREI